MVANLWHSLFAPLSANYCLYFYYISVFNFFIFAIAVVSLAWAMFSRKKGKAVIGTSISVIISTFVAYFVNRLLYTMCSKSI